MSNHVRFRFGMIALAAIMIVGMVLGAAAPALAGEPITTCAIYFDMLDYCAANFPPPDPQYVNCVAAVNESAEFYGLDVATCYPPSSCSEDGRVNTNCSAPEIVYCDEDRVDFYAYDYFTGEGEFDFYIPTTDLLQSVEVRTLLKQDGTVKVYLLPNGLVELLAPQSDGKIYFMIFDPYMCVSVQESAEWGLK